MIDPQSLSAPERLLWSHGFRKPKHIDLEGVALGKGADVIYRQLDGCAARLLTDGVRAVISIEASDSPGRQRFSLGHELAHWINDAKRASFKCSDDAIGPQNAEAASAEAHANVYARQLILPDYMVAPWLGARAPTLNVAAEMADAFKASLTASAIKLARRSAVPTCVVCHGQAGRKWYVHGKNWPFDLYPLKELHHETAAFDMVFKAGPRMSNPRKEPADRWLSGGEARRMSAQVQSVRLPDDTVLTTLAIVQGR